MGMRWQLYDPDFYTDVIFGFDIEQVESDEEVYICRCSGRGKSDQERRIPRMPHIKPQLEELQAMPFTSYDPNVRKKGKGRGRVLKEKAKAFPGLRGTRGTGCDHRDQTAIEVDRPRHEPLFLDNSSFVGKADIAVKMSSPFASLSKPTLSSETYEEDFPSLSSSSHSPRYQRSAVYDSDSGSSGLKDLNNLALPCKGSSSVHYSSLSSLMSDSSPEKSAVCKSSMSCRTSSEEALYISDTESIPSRSSETSENMWKITQGNIIQLDGLPRQMDFSTLEELIAQYGTIQETQVLEYEDSVAVRFRLTSEDACDWVVSCLDGTECLFPESNRPLHCCKV
ncbi:uncharacterized protein LOC132556129 [Ylistrum balloti]|uniref:uncharacterized protein LOC132556129 n=1 Tax=Ylistrum balloti TaxID=509963 RepID=UPI0029058CCB|nr:uncharacterized protein LOC132556129 [Ylistrum balloti]